jgi:fructose-bisphosphate aldolase class I
MMPILEPEGTISISDKPEAEQMLLDSVLRHLDAVPEGAEIMIKLTLPEVAGTYQPLVDHPKIMRVVALSGGYDLTEATRRLAINPGIIASFSRALTQDLSAQQSDDEFNAAIAKTIDTIHAASIAGRVLRATVAIQFATVAKRLFYRPLRYAILPAMRPSEARVRHV